VILADRIKMPNSKKLVIECGPESLSHFGSTPESSLQDQIKNIQQIADVYQLDLKIMIYSGVLTPLSGGRNKLSNHKAMNKPLLETERLIGDLNSQGIPFNLVLNGGLRFDLDIEPQILRGLDFALGMLVDIGNSHGIKNYATITHPRLFDYIRKDFYALGTIASCIQALFPYCPFDYRESFERYDYVVPLNQHVNPDFMKKYEKFADKMILFLTLGCGTSNLYKCYMHYIEIESEYTFDNEKIIPVTSKRFSPIPSKLNDSGFNCDNGALLNREDDLVEMISMHVNKFKIPRNGVFRKNSFSKLAELIHAHAPS
jgi:hypothetical protein